MKFVKSVMSPILTVEASLACVSTIRRRWIRDIHSALRCTALEFKGTRAATASAEHRMTVQDESLPGFAHDADKIVFGNVICTTFPDILKTSVLPVVNAASSGIHNRVSYHCA